MLYEIFSDFKNFLTVALIISFLIIAGATYYLKKTDKNYTIYEISEKLLPEDEIRVLKQVFYITMVVIGLISVIMEFYSMPYFWIETSVLDMIFSFIAIAIILLEKRSYIRIILLTLLVPLNSVYFLIFSVSLSSLAVIMNSVHSIVMVYAIIFFINEFITYTKNNNLGYTVVILMAIVSVSLFLTIIFEQRTILDSLIMVTNAFTSNGYSVLGTSTMGKIDSLFLTWGGYLLSCVGTATLTAAILSKNFDSNVTSIENEIKEYKEENEELREYIEKLNKKL